MAKKADFKKIKTKLEELTPEKREIAETLLDKAEFMAVELAKLQEIIKEKGWTEEYQNGANQRGVKKSSEGETYNVVLKNYNSTLAAICKLLPDEKVGGDELMDFIGR